MSDSPNFLTYAQTAFDPFEERPFCAVDSLVFAWLSYLRLPGDMAELTNWQGLDVRELLRAECYRDMIDDLWDPEGSRALLEAVAASPRYRGVHVCGYHAVRDVVATEQFAAMAFRFPAGLVIFPSGGPTARLWAGKRILTWRSGVLCRLRNPRRVMWTRRRMRLTGRFCAEVIPRVETLRCTVRRCAPMSPVRESNGRIPMMVRVSSRSF